MVISTVLKPVSFGLFILSTVGMSKSTVHKKFPIVTTLERTYGRTNVST